MDDLRDCLARLVPIIQRAAVNFYESPERANAIIVDAVEKYQDFWVYPPDLAEFSVQAQIDFGLVGNGPDNRVGNMEEGGVQSVLDSMRDADEGEGAEWNIPDDLVAADLFTNEFIDPSIGHP